MPTDRTLLTSYSARMRCSVFHRAAKYLVSRWNEFHEARKELGWDVIDPPVEPVEPSK